MTRTEWNRPVQLHVITAKGTTRRVKGQLDLGDAGFEVITDDLFFPGYHWQAILVLPAPAKQLPPRGFEQLKGAIQKLNSTPSAKRGGK